MLKSIISIQTIRDLLVALANVPGEVFPGCSHGSYAKGLYAPRTRGSITVKGLDQLSSKLELVDVTCDHKGAVAPGHRVYQAHTPELGGRVGAVPLNLLDRKDFDILKVRAGDHGIEVFLDVSLEERGALPLVKRTSFIIQEDYTTKDEDGAETSHGPVLATWHPGDPCGLLSKETADEAAQKLEDGVDPHEVALWITSQPDGLTVGVKLHNG